MSYVHSRISQILWAPALKPKNWTWTAEAGMTMKSPRKLHIWLDARGNFALFGDRNNGAQVWEVLRIFFKILVVRANFGFWYRHNFGNLGAVTFVRPYWDKFWRNLILQTWWYRQVMINHRGGILIFGQILMKSKVWILTKIENLKSLTLAEIKILDLWPI